MKKGKSRLRNARANLLRSTARAQARNQKRNYNKARYDGQQSEEE